MQNNSPKSLIRRLPQRCDAIHASYDASHYSAKFCKSNLLCVTTDDELFVCTKSVVWMSFLTSSCQSCLNLVSLIRTLREIRGNKGEDLQSLSLQVPLNIFYVVKLKKNCL
uniref:Uncharacterized protein n=1 Tax=Parascaris univalens TaxID=6257 RepID=A0A915B8P2_PARUN